MLPKVALPEYRVVAHAMEPPLHRSVGPQSSTSGYSRNTMLVFTRRTACCALLLCFTTAAAPVQAKRAPDPAFKTLDGRTRKLSALHGQVTVVNFWATWCGPCQEELPRLSGMAAGYEGQPVRFVVISIDEPKDRARIPAILTRLHVSLECWTGGSTGLLDRFGLGDIVPGTAILDQQGEIVARIMGEAREQDVRKAVDWLLSGKTAPAPAPLTKRY